MKKFLFLSLAIVAISFFGCGDDGDSKPVDNFDRSVMLINWADNIIVPAYEASVASLTALETAAQNFRQDATAENLEAVQTTWLAAYRDWQRSGMFQLGKAEELLLIELMNLYPTDFAGIEANIAGGNYNLDLPSQTTRQGFPALDYLLYGIGADNAEVLAAFQDAGTGEGYREYVLAAASKMRQNMETVLSDWKNGYRDTFVGNAGSDANASTDRMTNDFIFYYEKHLRAGKVGIPAGVFSGDKLAGNVEAFYNKNVSKELLLVGLDAMQDFFNGVSYDGAVTGASMNAYLEELGSTKSDSPLATVINDQFDEARTVINGLGNDFAQIVDNDNISMLRAYDALQLNVVNIKVDMLQAMCISVDYIDGDGD